ncbi:MAG: anthranilate phosphoribosyltransferase [Planctomycetota bacterium]|jgi:anthranilate phosphoribosyltransferase
MQPNDLLELVASGTDLSAAQTQELLGYVLDESTPDSVVAAALMGLRTKGESASELQGAVQGLLEHCLTVPNVPSGSVDTCGTGGDNAGTINISTAAAFVVAACGVPVVKHGNRSVSSQSGSADVLEALGVPFHTPDQSMSSEFIFCFAPQFHPRMKRVGPVRREMKIRTLFNLVGPLANPGRPDFQLVGVADKSKLSIYAEALQALGRKRTFVVHGEPGVDEATPAGDFTVLHVTPTAVNELNMSATDFGLPLCTLEDLAGGGAKDNAADLQTIFGGQSGPKTDCVVLNAALTLMLTGKAESPTEAASLASAAIQSGKVADLLKRLQETVNA